jgi:uncharacterized glyoxalase superfamily protein PhnB
LRYELNIAEPDKERLMTERPAIVPCVFYRDPLGAMKWLEAAFGFETTELVTDDAGRVGHAEMQFRGAPVEVGGEWQGPELGGARMLSPASLGGAATQFLRISLDGGIEAHCEQARSAGAEIIQEPEDQFYGARTYRAKDPEGHVWNFSQEVRKLTMDEMAAASGLKFRTSLTEA